MKTIEPWVAEALALTQMEVTAAELLLNHEEDPTAARAASDNETRFNLAVEMLIKRGLLTRRAGGVLDLLPLRLRAEAVRDGAEPKLVFRSLKDQLRAIARGGQNGADGLARVFAFLYGVRTTDYPLLGKIAKQYGVENAALLMLRVYLEDENPKTALPTLAARAFWEADMRKQGGVRPETAPDPEEQARQYRATTREGVRERVARYEAQGGKSAVLEAARRLIDPVVRDLQVRTINLDYAEVE